MIRGTTATVVYKFPFPVQNIDKFRMYFLQGNETLVTKTEEDCTFGLRTVSVTLTQEETYTLSSKKRLGTRARFSFNNGRVGGTKMRYLDVYDSGGDEEILESEG